MGMISLRSAAVVCGAGLVVATSGCQLVRFGTVAGTSPQRTEPVRTTAELIHAMHARHSDNWYTTLSAKQQNIRWAADGREARSDWAEYVRVPGRLRIEFLPWNSRSGVLFENGRVHTFDDGRRLETRRQLNPLLLLSADVYVVPPESTLAALRRAGVNVSHFHERSWNGSKVYVAGALAGDTARTQLWVDAQRLVLVRWVERVQASGRSIVTDTHLRNYRDVDGYPIAHESVIYRDGRRVLREVYTAVQVNPPLSPALFDPARWRDAPRPQEPSGG